MFNDHNILKYLFNQKELNMRQRRWMHFMKDYDFDLNYDPQEIQEGGICFEHERIVCNRTYGARV